MSMERVREALVVAVEGCSSVLDVGAGAGIYLRSLPIARRLAIEPHPPHAETLFAMGVQTVFIAPAQHVLPALPDGHVDAVLCLDMIEHMTREGGAELLRLMLLAQPKQIVVFTPNGFLAQDGPDPWGLGGETWQKHRSGWTQEDFPATDWWIEYYGRGFLATWTNGFASLLTN